MAVSQLLDGHNNIILELFAPISVQLVDLLILLDDELLQVRHERLGCLSVLLRLHPIVLGLLRAVFLALITMRFLLLLRRENSWRRQYFVKVLELLACLLLVLISDKVAIDLRHVREAVHDERTQQNGVRNFVALDRQGRQALERLQLRNLNETVDVVVLEE